MHIGDIRRAQLITTFGIGAVVDLPEHSVMIAGQNFWNPALLDDIHEPRLEKKHRVSGFRQPEQLDNSPGTKDSHSAVPSVRFPLWHFCGDCRKLAPLPAFGSLNETKCPKCSRPRDPKRLLPSRFVIACKGGHIDDFPYDFWLRKHGCSCQTQRLEISTTGRTTSLAGIRVRCLECATDATLEGIFAPDALAGFRCTGQRPWLGDRQSDCQNRPRVTQRGSSSLYFPIRDSALSIPPFSTIAFHVLEKHWSTLKLVPDENAKTVTEQLAEINQIDVSALWAAYCHLKSYQQGEAPPDIKYEEYIALCEPDAYNAKHDFAAVRTTAPRQFADVFSRVVLVKRLRMVTVLKAFARLDSGSNPAPISNKPEDWLPAMDVNGEGIFLEFAAERLAEWRKRGSPELERRAEVLEQRRKALIAVGRTTMEDVITPEFLLIHTFSHLLIRMLVNECGYSSAALSERIYAREGVPDSDPARRRQAMRGLLVYTASADSEGSLGGLVRQGEPGRLSGVLLATLEQAGWCSNDPLCIESQGQGSDSRNLGACHACALLPETSCEHFNGFLDRGVLVGFPKNPEGGFFSKA
jgi:hypothetical protein